MTIGRDGRETGERREEYVVKLVRWALEDRGNGQYARDGLCLNIRTVFHKLFERHVFEA